MDTIRLYNNIDTITFNAEEDKMNIAGYACHFGTRNLNGELCFKETFNQFFEAYKEGKVRPILNFDHQNDKQIGMIDAIDADATGLYVMAHINRNIPWCRDWLIPNIEMGDIKSFSTELAVIGGRNGVKINDDGTYDVLAAHLIGCAVVQHPADYRSEFTVKNYLDSLPKEEEDVKEELNKSKWYLFI